MRKKKYYKAFERDLTCKGFQYKIGSTYEMEGPIIPCKRGFHFCDDLKNVYSYYPVLDHIRVCEVEPLGDIIPIGKDKYVTNKIYIKKEIKNPKKITNIGKNCTGFFNSGNNNSGNFNSGDKNSGDYNSGNFNSGNYNFGNFNSGHSNIGDFNICSKSLGVFNVVAENYKIKMFDEPSNWTLSDWYDSEAYNIMKRIPTTCSHFVNEQNMTEEEKQEHPEYKTLGGFTKVCIVTNEDKQEWWNKLTEDKKEIVKALPNFDPYKFKLCTGIKV